MMKKLFYINLISITVVIGWLMPIIVPLILAETSNNWFWLLLWIISPSIVYLTYKLLIKLHENI